MLAPNAPLRAATTTYGRDADLGGAPPAAKAPASPDAAATKARPAAHYPWAALIARLFLTLLLVCPRCGADRRIIAFITETAPVQRMLTHIGEPAAPPRIAPPADRRPGTTHRC